MKRLIKVTCLAFTMFLLMFSFAAADNYSFENGMHVYTFEDTMVNWYGHDTKKDYGDSIGTPKVEDMVVYISEDGKLNKVVINVEGRTKDKDKWDGIFINTSFDGNMADYQDWDYYIYSNFNGKDSRLYDISDYNYTYTEAANTKNTIQRAGHPNGISFKEKGKDKKGRTKEIDKPYDKFSGVSYKKDIHSNDYFLTFDFSNLEIFIDSGFYIAYTPYCANDVTGGWGILPSEPDDPTNQPVPEPATLILTGLGLLGLSRARRNKKA